MDLHINPERFKAHFDQLARIGQTPTGGIHRPAFSPTHLEARCWLREQITKAGLELTIDPAGNHFAHVKCGRDRPRYLLLGSHLDSVPEGGRFDGALGVLAALEVLHTIHESDLSLPVDLKAVDFSDEEGAYICLLGSRAFCGTLSQDDLEEPRGGKQAFSEALAQAGISEAGLLSASSASQPPLAYLELHIEQSRHLEHAQAQIGVPTTIVGIRSYRMDFLGRAEHAGTTPMQDRSDAVLGASGFALQVRDLLLDEFPECVGNIGDIQIHPGVFNIIPGKARLSFELRSPAADQLEALEVKVRSLAERVAHSYGLDFQYKPLGGQDPTEMNKDLRQTILETAADLGLTTLAMPSYAGHDAQALAARCPSAMIFIPSVAGRSHSPSEFSSWADCLNGVELLLQVALKTALKAA